MLLANVADVHACGGALAFAAENGYDEEVKLLLEHGANVHARNDAALIEASENGYVEVVEILLEHGADVHAINDEALIEASANGSV
ncbi:putative ankyrin repeat protein [Clostridium sp. CAG:1219]|nr:putative ankyrin repeat protein [Clostridium sp. CAG:1219]